MAEQEYGFFAEENSVEAVNARTGSTADPRSRLSCHPL